MGEAAPELNPTPIDPQSSGGAELEVVQSSPEGAFFDPDVLLDEVFEKHMDGFKLRDEWPDLDLQFSEASIVGSPDRPIDTSVNSITRARTVLLALEEQAPESLNRPRGQSTADSLKLMLAYLKKGPKIAGQVAERRVLLPPGQVIKRLERIWQETNHPVGQAMETLRRDYGDRLSPEVLEETEFAIILNTQQTLIVNIYKDYMAGFRKIAQS